MKFPEDLKYTKNDEWVRVQGGTGAIGISDFAQDQLSDIVYLEIRPSVGDSVKQGEVIGTVESVKASSDVYSPVSGKVLETNDALLEKPELINSDPYGEAWLVKLELSGPAELDGLLTASAYEADTKERG